MRRMILYGATAALLGLTTSCRSFDSLMDEYRHETDAEYHHVEPAMFGLGRMLARGEEGKVLRAIRKVRTLDLEDCAPDVRARFARKALNYRPKGYEPLVTANEGDEHTRLLIRQKRGAIRELLIISIDDNECSMTQVKGRVRPNDIERWTKWEK